MHMVGWLVIHMHHRKIACQIKMPLGSICGPRSRWHCILGGHRTHYVNIAFEDHPTRVKQLPALQTPMSDLITLCFGCVLCRLTLMMSSELTTKIRQAVLVSEECFAVITWLFPCCMHSETFPAQTKLVAGHDQRALQ